MIALGPNVQKTVSLCTAALRVRSFDLLSLFGKVFTDFMAHNGDHNVGWTFSDTPVFS